MNKQGFIGMMLLFLLFIFSVKGIDSPLSLNSESAMKMGKQIWYNECKGKVEGLTSWNQGEEFASLGIGHFIWYPEGIKIVFKQSFPGLLVFFKEQGVVLPMWLSEARGCPWKSRSEFLESLQSPEMIELRKLLADQISLQVMFMVQRLQKALPMMIGKRSDEQKKHITYQFNRLSSTPEGVFVLLDYINFKGEGVSETERYNGQGWGLLQVLETMSGQNPGTEAISEFIISAKEKLSRRVQNSPPERNEKKWLSGWFNRLDSYKNFSI